MTEPQFRVGQSVRIQARNPGIHHRVPTYAKGCEGRIERICGMHGQPETFIRGDGQPQQRLYRVRISQAELWDTYEGSPHDCLDIEIFEHWLDPLE